MQQILTSVDETNISHVDGIQIRVEPDKFYLLIYSYITVLWSVSDDVILNFSTPQSASKSSKM